MSAKGRAEQVSAELFFKLKHSLPSKQAQEQVGYITTAAQAAYASLNKLDWTKTFYAEVNLTPNTDSAVSFDRDSSSAGLGYALALALEWRKQLNKSTDYEAEVFATGEIHSSGAVTEIGHLETKITAACNFMERKNAAPHAQHLFVIFYPIANQNDVTPELQTRVVELGGKLCPVERLQSALITLLGNVYDGDAEGRWEPFKGLLSFNYEDNLRFFGRERALTKLSKEFNEAEGLVVCTGISGSGKSSLIKSALIPQINQELPEGHTLDWLISTPKAHNTIDSILFELLNTLDKHWPIGTNSKDKSDENKNSDLEALSKEAIQSPDTFIATIQQAQLSQSTKRIFYYIDQYEDIFNHQEISREQAKNLAPLLAQLAKKIPNLDIVISIRSEYEDILGKYGNVSHVNPELNASEWGDIVYKQATSFGLRYEPKLEKCIVDEAASLQHALPALEYLLEQLYKKAKKADKNARLLTHEHYEQLNGIRGVIAARAEEVIAKYPMQAHAFFEYFVGLNNENKPYAKSVNTTEAKQDSEALYDLIQAFIDAQLVVDCSTEIEKRVKLAHDTLFNFDNHDSAWTALKDWFEENQEYLKWLNAISGDFKRWSALSHNREDLNNDSKSNFSNTFLLNEHDLSLGLGFQQENNIQQPKVRGYITQSQQYKEALLKQKNNKQRLVILLVSVFLLIAVGAGFIAYQKEQEVKHALLEASQKYALALNEKAIGLIKNKNINEALVYTAYQKVYQSAPIDLHYKQLYGLNTHTVKIPGKSSSVDDFEKINFSEDGKNLISISDEIKVWSLKSGNSTSLKGYSGYIRAVTSSKDGRFFAGSSDGSLWVWNNKNEQPIKLIQSKSGIISIFLDEDNEILYTAFDSGVVKVLDIKNNKFEFIIKTEGVVFKMKLSNGGNTLFTLSYDGNIRIIDLNDIASVRELVTVPSPIESFDLSKDGKVLVFSSKNGSIYVKNEGSEKLRLIGQHISSVTQVLFSENEEFIFSTSYDNTVKRWDLSSGNSKLCHDDYELLLTSKQVNGIFASVNNVGDVNFWDANTCEAISSGLSQSASAIDLSKNNRSLFIGRNDGSIRIFDLSNGKSISFAHAEASIVSIYSMNNAQHVTSLDSNGNIHVLDVKKEKSRKLNNKEGFANNIYSNGNILISHHHKTRKLLMWDILKGTSITLLSGRKSAVIQSIHISQDGKKVITITGTRVQVFNLIDDLLTLVKTISIRSENMVASSLSKNGDYLVLTSSFLDELRLVNLNTGNIEYIPRSSHDMSSGIAISSEGDYIISGDDVGYISINKAYLFKWEVIKLKIGESRLTDVIYSDDGKFFITVDFDSNILVFEEDGIVFDLLYLRYQNNITLDSNQSVLLSSKNILIEDAITKQLKYYSDVSNIGDWGVDAYTLSSDKELLAFGANWSGKDNCFINIVNLVSDEKNVFEIKNCYDFSSLLLVDNNKKIIAFSTVSDFYIVLDLISGEYEQFDNFAGGISKAVKLDGDERVLAAGYDGTIRVLDSEGNNEKTLFGHRDQVTGLAIKNGILFSGSKDGTVRMWDLESNNSEILSTSNNSSVNNLVYSEEHELLVVVHSTVNFNSKFPFGFIEVIDLVEGTANKIYGFDSSISDVSFSADNRSILVNISLRNLKLDLSFFTKTKSEYRKLISQYESRERSYLHGVEIEYKQLNTNLYTQPATKPQWSKNHPFHWHEKAEQGDPEALLQLGIIAQRDKEWDKAKDYYQKAKVAGHKNADYRLKINELMRKEYSKEPVH